MMIPCKALHWSGLVMAHYWHVMNDWISQLLILEYFFFFKKRSDRCSLWIDHHCLIGLGEIGLVDPDFCRKCPFSSAKKWHFECPNLRTDYKNLAKPPPKWWGRHLVHAFPFPGEYQANFEKLHIFLLFWSNFRR